MTSPKLLIPLVVLIFSLTHPVFSQTGPGGVGNATGASGQPQNVLWLKSDAGITQSSGFVNAWADQSGNNNHATGSGGTRPSYTSSDGNFNSFPSINFPNTATTNYYLQVADNDNLDNTDQLSVFAVLRPTSNVPATTLGILSKRVANNNNQSYYFELTTNPRYRVAVGTAAVSNLNGTNNTALNQNDIITMVMTGATKNGYRDGGAAGTVTGDNVIPNNASDLYIGTYDAASNNGLEGAIVEVLVYRTALNEAQRRIVENYLSSKYVTALSTGDIFAGDSPANGDHDFELTGIAQISGSQHVLGNSAGVIIAPASGTLNVNDESILMAHSATSNAVSVANLGTGVAQRWARTWYFDKRPGTGVDVTLTFDFSEGIGGQFPQNKDNYVLLRNNAGTYEIVSGITNANKSIVGDQVVFNVADANLSSGIYTLGTINAVSSPVNGASNRTWYSYQSGNWTDATSWTLDGGIFPLYVNPSNETPGASDNVVVSSGKTITVNTSNIQINSLQVIGTVDLGTTTGHNFIDINGDGRIRMAGTSDNFPSGDATDFADATVGGTVEIYGTGMTLNQTRTFNNLEINMTGSSDVASLLVNYSINGNFLVNNGLFRFNDNLTVANRTLTVYGDVTVASGGGIRVGTGNSAGTRHELNLYGDFTNEGGTAYFTNRATANTASEAIDGIVDFNTISPSQDQNVVCNGVTRFYRIEISKGTNDTYKTSLQASATANFNLFGYAAEDHGSVAQLTGNANALGLIYGTVELTTNVVVSVLSTASNYNISEGAQLWVNGGTLNKNSGNSLVPYGKVRVSDGILTSNVSAGITTRDNGAIIVEGGTVTTNQIRTSVEGPTNIGSYIQSGGTVTVDGDGPGGTGLDYYVFSLSYPGNVFNMSGGDLIVKGTRSGTSGTRGAIYINSDVSNISVTGGRVIFEISNGNSYKVTSRAPFWNVLMRRTAGAATVVELNNGDTGTGVGLTSLTKQPLVVLNDLTIESPINFTTNDASLTIGGNLEIKNGGIYTHGTNTTTINGEGVSSLTFGNTGATQTFSSLTINKTNLTDEVGIVTGNATALRVNGALTISSGIFDYSTFIVSTRGTVTFGSGVTVGKSASTGRILMDGTAAQTLNSSGASVYNLQLSNSFGTSPQVSLATGDLTVLGTLTLSSGIFSIGTNKLSLSSSTSVLAGSPFSATKMIQTSGLSSDGGLELYVGANGAIDYPFGVAGKYAPARPQIQSFSDNGLIRIVPVDAILSTTAGSQSILSFYWKVSYSNFTTLPIVSYQFRYDQADVDANENQYVAGKVTDYFPYDRIEDPNTGGVDNVDETNNLIVFNGTTNGLTFPGTGFTLEAANYTAARTSRFNGVLDTYYSVTSGDWNTGSTWSRNDPTGGGPPNVPTAGSIVVIQSSGGVGHRVNVLTGTVSVSAVQFDATGVVSPNSENVPRLQFWAGGTNPLGFVSGTGMISFDAPDAPVVTGDFNDFGSNTNSYYLYFGGNATLTNIPTPIPNLMFESATYTVNQAINVGNDLIVQGNGILQPIQTVNITRDLLLGYWLGGSLRLPGVTAGITMTVGRNIDYTQDPFASPNTRELTVNYPGDNTIQNTVIVKGDILQGASNTSTLDLYNGATNRPLAVLEFQGAGNHVYSRTSTSVPDLYRIVCNKGSDISSSFSINETVVLNAPTNTSTKAITITNGLLINNNTGSYVLSSGGGDFNIPGTGGLEVMAGTVSMTTTATSANITLDGLLRISGGTATIDAGAGFTNYIEYTNSGNSAIEISSGALTVGGQVRRGLSSTTGVLKYTQSNGTVIIGNRGAPITTRGVFEVLNTGSEFHHTGGTFTLVNGINSTTVPSLWLEPETSTINSGSSITIGSANTVAGVNAQNIGIKSLVSLYNLTISGSNNPVVKIYTSPLTVANNLIVNSSTTFNANAINLTIGGNFTVDGSYVSGNNTTTFTDSGAASISGITSALSFYSFTKTGAGTLTLSKDISINRDLTLSSGVLSSGTNLINLRRHATIDGTMSSASGQGLIFNGSGQQLLQRSSAGTGSLGIVTINNTSGVLIPDGNGYNFSITGGLRLEQGIFDIGGSLLELGVNALITPVNAFSVTNMIQTNSSFTDFGVRKQFPANYTTNFVFPVGQLAYTPVTFDFSSPTNTTGSVAPTITVRPANERHPSVVNDDEDPVGAGPEDFDDLQNVLQYHWIVNADNVNTSFKSGMTLSYTQSLVSVTAPRTEADYIAARILSDANPSLNINKFSTSEVDEVSNVISFTFTGVNDAGISGDYFAGVDLAIPSNVPIYTTNGSGNYTSAIYTPSVPGGGAPIGAAVIVRAGDELILSTNGASFYSTEINGKVTVNTGTIGHRLGYLSGTGDLQINSNTASLSMPAAVYDDFFSCAGGGLIFGGSGAYEILGGITSLRNLTIEGGTRTMGDNDLTVCNDLTISSGAFSNSKNRTIVILNDLLITGGTYSNAAGVLTITRDLVSSGSGTFNGGTGGTKTIGRDMTITGGTLTSGSGSANRISIGRNMTVADAATFTGGTVASSGMRYVFSGSSQQTLTGNFTNALGRAINRLEINNTSFSNGLVLVGDIDIASNIIFTDGVITPQAKLTMLGAATASPVNGLIGSFVNGRLYKVVSTTGGFTFPIGKGAIWRPAAVSNLNTAGDTWDAEYFYAPATGESLVNNLSPVAPILRIAQGEYWKISDGAAVGRTARIGLSWGILSDVSTTTAQREAMQVMAWNDGLTRWDAYGGANFSAGHTQNFGSFYSSSSLSFSENIVTLGSTETANPLPVELLSFTGINQNGFNKLDWKTASELNNDYFELQRSGTGEEFAAIGKIQGKGTTNDLSTYTFIDEQPYAGKNYYRLKQVDFNGDIEYSDIILVTNESENVFNISVFPNPASKEASITIRTIKGDEYEATVHITDMTGRTLTSYVIYGEGSFEQKVNVSTWGEVGIYLVEMRQGSRRVFKRLMLN